MSIHERITRAREATKHLKPGVRVQLKSGEQGEIVGPGHGENVHGYIPLFLVALDDPQIVGYLPAWWDELQPLEAP